MELIHVLYLNKRMDTVNLVYVTDIANLAAIIIMMEISTEVHQIKVEYKCKVVPDLRSKFGISNGSKLVSKFTHKGE